LSLDGFSLTPTLSKRFDSSSSSLPPRPLRHYLATRGFSAEASLT
jgi:hypothetical protein